MPGVAGGYRHHQMLEVRQESSDSLLSPGDFCPVFAELLFQACQKVASFPRNPNGMSFTSQACEGTCTSCWVREPAAGQGHRHVTGTAGKEEGTA